MSNGRLFIVGKDGALSKPNGIEFPLLLELAVLLDLFPSLTGL